MERLYRAGDFLKRNKDIIQPLTTLALCVLVALLYLFPTRTQTVIVQPPATPTAGQTEGTPAPSVQEVKSATSSLSPSSVFTNGVNPDALDQNNSQSSGSSGNSSGGGSGNTKPPVQPPAVLCDSVTSGGGALTLIFDRAAMLRGEKVSVSITSPNSIPLGSIFMAPTGKFLVSPATLSSTTTSASFIAQYDGGYTAVPGVDPTDVIGITARCGGATSTGNINLL